MSEKYLFHIFYIITAFFYINSLDNHTLSNYLDIVITNLTGIFEPDFNEKIVKGNLTYTFHSNNDGFNIILDSKFLNICSITEKNDSQIIELAYEYGEEDENLGTPLIINRKYSKSEDIIININFKTTTYGGSAQFLDKSQTIGKKQQYFFTFSEMTFGRQLLPSQDTPAVKFPFYLGIKVINPLRGMISGLYDKNETNKEDNTTTFYYYQKIPIPNYLIALAAGDIVEKKVSDIISVFTEPIYINNATSEFEMMPDFLNYAIEYMGNYSWGQYNVLVLPYSCPYSGMENPCLTFCSPCLINGDKSLVDLIAHELIHSWSGNLVTNENWRDFWLNEGITKFLQRKVIARWQNIDYAKMDYLLGLSYIRKYLVVFGENSTFTSLRPNMTGILPDSTYSNIPYEKGSNFVYYLENIIGNKTIQAFFQNYFEHFKYKSLDVFDFKNYFIEFCSNNGIDEDTLNKIEWDQWIFQPGDCPIPNNFSNRYDDQLNKTLEKFINEDFNDLENEFKELISSAKTVFFLRLEERNIFLTEKQHDFLTNKLKLYKNQNFLVTTHYLRLILKETDKFYEHEMDCLKNYLNTYGVSDFMDGIYRLFYQRDEIESVKMLDNLTNFYHPIMMKMARNEIDDANQTFPIFSFDLDKDKCLMYSEALIFNISSVDFRNDYKERYVNDSVFLENSNNKKIKLECYLNPTEKYCHTIENIIHSGEYHLTIPERIQKKEYAVKKTNGVYKYKIYLNESNVDEEQTKKIYEIDYGISENGETIKIYFTSGPDNSIKVMNEEKEIKCEIEKNITKCLIKKEILNYDLNNKAEYKNYTLKVIDLCNEEKYSFIVRVKNSKDEEDKKEEDGKKEGLKTWMIILIAIGGALIVFVIGFLILKAIKRKENNLEVDDIKKDKLMAESKANN